MSTRDRLVAAGAGALGAGAFVGALPWLIQPMLRLLLWPRYRLRVRGFEHLPPTGPALLVVNHVTWIDGFILAAACPRRGRALVNATIIDRPILRGLAGRAGLIAVPFSGPRAVRAAIK